MRICWHLFLFFQSLITDYNIRSVALRIVAQYLIIGAKTRAALLGKMTPDEKDINAVAPLVLRHRILRNFKAEADGIRIEDIISELIKV